MGSGMNFTYFEVVDPNYKAPNLGPLLIGLMTLTIVLAGIVVFLRLYARSRRSGIGGLGIEDWLMVIALALTIGITTVNCLGIQYGCFGKYAYECTIDNATAFSKTLYAHTILSIITAATIKTSILMYYRRLFCPVDRELDWATRILIVFVIVYSTCALFIFAFMCNPICAFWDIRRQTSTACPSVNGMLARLCTTLSLHVATDIIILLLPMKVVYKLNLSKRQKAVLVLLFGAGAIACVASVIRLAYYIVFQQTKKGYLEHTRDGAMICFWGQLEKTAGMIAASVPSLRSLFTRRRRQRRRRGEASEPALSTGKISRMFNLERFNSGGNSKDSEISMAAIHNAPDPCGNTTKGKIAGKGGDCENKAPYLPGSPIYPQFLKNSIDLDLEGDELCDTSALRACAAYPRNDFPRNSSAHSFTRDDISPGPSQSLSLTERISLATKDHSTKT